MPTGPARDRSRTPPALQVVDRPHRLEVAPAKPVDGGHHQDVALGEQLVQEVPPGARAARLRA